MDREARYFIAESFWRWCRENRITGVELGDATGYSGALVNAVRRAPQRTVSERFVSRVRATYNLPTGAGFFQPAGFRYHRRRTHA